MAEGTGAPSETVIAADIIEVTEEEPVRAAKKTRSRQMPKWEADARDRLRTAVRRFARPLADLIARGANEGGTRLRRPTGHNMDPAELKGLDQIERSQARRFIDLGQPPSQTDASTSCAKSVRI
jgi:hypothetical protein